MDDYRDDASHASSSPFNSMDLNSPGLIDSHNINRQEHRQHAISPRTELIVLLLLLWGWKRMKKIGLPAMMAASALFQLVPWTVTSAPSDRSLAMTNG